MSNDLISRSIVMDYLREQETNIITEKNKKGFVSADVCDGMISAIGAFKNYIMQVPAAYDSDKVIKELEEYAHSDICGPCRSCRISDDINNIECENCGALGALEIVKGGGIRG